MTRFIIALPLLLLCACEGAESPLPAALTEEASRPATAAGLDSLADGAEVSLSGLVLDQPAGEARLVLDDGTGLVVVETPEPLPALGGLRLFVRGTLARRDGAPVVEAVEWLYDSTAVPVRPD